MTTARAAGGQRAGTAGPRRNYPRWRAVSLSFVYLVFAIHIIHWKVSGTTLAPLELNEVMYTLELGIVTAGFLFMSLLVLGTVIFGRFFCSWACHIMVLQELSARLLRRLGILAKPIRSRFLLWVPPLTAGYMFLWPQIVRAWGSRALPTFHWATDRDGWASLVTNNFWRNLPGPWIIVLTFLVCGVLMIYLLGSRTFCTYVCPYGAIFALADRFSPGRIVVGDNCKQCGRCTQACMSGVRVHEETAEFGRVVNPACLKCLDCVSVCPQGTLHYGLAKPAFFAADRRMGRFGLRYDFSLAEDILAAIVFIGVVLTFRGLYGRIPFLLSLAIGVTLAYGVVLWIRLLTQSDVRFSTVVLRRQWGWSPAGRAYFAAMVLLSAFVAHSAFVRYHEYTGLRAAIRMNEGQGSAGKAHAHLLTADRWGLIPNERVERGMVMASAALGKFVDLSKYADRYLARHPADGAVHLTVGRTLVRMGQVDAGEKHFQWITANLDPQTSAGRPLWLSAKMDLVQGLVHRGSFPAAELELRDVVTRVPDHAPAHAELGSTLAELGRFSEAIAELKEARRLDPSSGGAAYNLGTLLLHLGRFDEAASILQQAAQRITDDADLFNNLGSALLRAGRPDEAEAPLRTALQQNPSHADAHFNLGMVLRSRGDVEQASDHLRQAASLDQRYAELLGGNR